jgi:hypothetical protein
MMSICMMMMMMMMSMYPSALDSSRNQSCALPPFRSVEKSWPARKQPRRFGTTQKHETNTVIKLANIKAIQN